MIRYIACFITLIHISFILSAQDTVTQKIVIFPKEKGVHAANDSPTSRFTPITDEIKMVDEIVKAHIKEKYPQASNVLVDNYYRQYYGSILMGQRIIFINGCCTKPEKFTEEMYFAKGGGNCYFNAKINLQTKKIMSFRFNAGK